MCGLAGILSRRNPIDTSVLAQMGHILHHRGPDDAGFLTLQQATGRHRSSKQIDLDDDTPFDLGMAFRRLKIIDLSERGAQPMTNVDESVWLTFNGEIYNYIELREELAARGRHFHSASDTEVILALYEAEGLDAFKRLNGMFAIALWDQRLRRLVLARDRFGVKPLYYAETPDGFVFGSEIKALLCHPSVKTGIDALALSEHLAFQFPLADRTLFSGVRLLEPGSLLMVEGDKPHRIERFWRLNYRPRSDRSLQSWAADMRERLLHAIRRQVRSDVPVGTFLSGGMDTGSISALSARSIDPLHTFTCGFHVGGMNGVEQLFDERQDARDLATKLGTLHHELEVGASDLAALLPAVVWHLEETRVGISYQIYKLSELVRRHVTVVLSGTGGDEMFAGYPWRYDPILTETDPARFEQRFYEVWCRLTSDAQRSELLSDRVLRSLSGSTPRDGFNAALADTAGLDPLHRALRFEAENFLQGVLLVEDRLNMAFSVEARVPLLDNELVDLLETMPADMKYNGAQTKIVLREALRGILPDEVLTRRKQGFTPPDETWMRTVSRPYIERILLSDQSLDRGLFRPESIRDILQAHFDGRDNHRFLIWSLLCIEWMQRLFVDGERPAELPATASALVTSRAA
jgi:asparagine synthase (glutamine-hydrolysing)